MARNGKEVLSLLLLAIIIVMLQVGCGSDTAPPTGSPQPVSRSQELATEALEATDTAVPTATAEPTETPNPPTDTPVPPTDTPEPSDTPAPTQTPLPTDTPIPTETPSPPTATSPPPSNTPAPSPTPAPTQPAQARVVIESVYNQSYDEHVVITNKGSAPADLSGWTVSGSKGDETFTFPAGYTLAPGVSMRLYSGKNGENNPPASIYWTDKTVWNNDGERVYLKNAQGNLVHEYSY